MNARSKIITVVKRVQYRIEMRGPRARAWHYLPFAGAASGMLPPPEAGVYANDPVEKLREHMERAKAENPGHKFRITGRRITVTTTATPWTAVKASRSQAAGNNNDDNDEGH